MASEILFALWFFLPAGAANVTPILVAKIPVLARFDQPIDFGLKYRGRELLGKHKTVRGFVSGSLIGFLVFVLQIYCFKNYIWAADLSGGLHYGSLPLITGFLLGFGALFGDALKSFFKRQFDLASGRSWFPFDQLDYIAGGLIFSAFVVSLNFVNYLTIFIVWFLMHLLASYVGYILKLKKDPI